MRDWRSKEGKLEGGLTSLAGGWEGSDELARLLDESTRIGQKNYTLRIEEEKMHASDFIISFRCILIFLQIFQDKFLKKVKIL